MAEYEVPTNPYWRGVMKRVRESHGLDQGDVAEAVGVKQATISEIETGKIKASRVVPAICLMLNIPSPLVMVQDEYDERWVHAGRWLRHWDMDRFVMYLKLFEKEGGIEPPDYDQAVAVPSSDVDAAEEGPGRDEPGGARGAMAGRRAHAPK